MRWVEGNLDNDNQILLSNSHYEASRRMQQEIVMPMALFRDLHCSPGAPTAMHAVVFQTIRKTLQPGPDSEAP